MKGNPIEEASKNYKSRIGKKYKKEDVHKIWNCLSEWIGDSLMSYKCVLLKNVGTFTLCRWKLDTGIRKMYPVQKPAFFLSNKLILDFGLKQTRQYASNKLPLVVPNYLLLSNTSGCDRTTVEDCISEILQALSRMLYEERDLRMRFPEIGELDITDKVVSFSFEESFVDKMSLRTPPIPRPPTACQRWNRYQPKQPVASAVCTFHKYFNEMRKKVDV